MEPAAGETAPKEKIILSVARFESGGSKQQLEMINVFAAPARRGSRSPERLEAGSCGGSADDNPYLDRHPGSLAAEPGPAGAAAGQYPPAELKAWYGRAAIFWHLCGLGQSDPANVEHFGMSTVEAMQNGCLPIVFDGGGQREIVEHGVSGFRFASAGDLRQLTLRAIADAELRRTIGLAARTRGADFNRAVFSARVRGLFLGAAGEYAAGEALAPAERR